MIKNNKLKTISNEVRGTLTVSENSNFHNVHLQSLVVEEDIIVRLYGVVEESIHIKRGALVYLHGKLFGKVINEGGVVYLFNPNGQVESFQNITNDCSHTFPLRRLSED